MQIQPVKQLDIASVQRWVVTGSRKLSQPASIGISCPECGLRGVFTTKRRNYDEHRDALSCSANCPACDTLVHFWVMDLIGQSEEDSEVKSSLYMTPSAARRMDLQEVPESTPENVVQYLSSTQDVYFSGNLVATGVLAQATLETMFSEFMPVGNSRTTLSKLIQDSINSIDLDKPLINLATSLREGGSLDKLIGNGKTINQESADAIMHLLEHLITFLYVIPDEFSKLDELFAELSNSASSDGDREGAQGRRAQDRNTDSPNRRAA